MKIKLFIKESLIKLKDIFLKWLKIFGKSLLKILTIISLLMFIIIPFLHNSIDHRWAQWLWYPSCAVTFFLTIIDYIKNKDPICKTPQIEFLRKLGDIWLFPVFRMPRTQVFRAAEHRDLVVSCFSYAPHAGFTGGGA